MSSKNSKHFLAEGDIEKELMALQSSEDEDSSDEIVECPSTDYFDDVNIRLDEIQCTTRDELHNILAEGDLDESVLHENEPTLFNDQSPNILQSPDVSVLNQPTTSETLLPLIPEQNTEETTYHQLQTKVRKWYMEAPVKVMPEFTTDIKPTATYNNRSLPIDYFNNLFPSELFDILVLNTNINATQKNIKNWKDTNMQELSAYLGIVILMGLNVLSEIDLYWSTDEFYNNPVISRVMTCKRFKKIAEAFHINDIRKEIPRGQVGHDKLQKIRPMVSILKRTFTENATQSSHYSVDESMVKFKGRSTLKQYMSKKPIKRGYKIWAICDSKTGYLYDFNVYTGKDEEQGEESGLGFKVVSKLSKNVPAGSIVAFDNFFSSLPLLEHLYEREIYSVGTYRIDRKGLPSQISGKEEIKEKYKNKQVQQRTFEENKKKLEQKKKEKKAMQLKPGEFMFMHASPVTAYKWRDTKDVHVMTTAHNAKDITKILRTQKDGSKKLLLCPQAIVDYTKYMGGVDHFDHYRSSYSIGRRSKKNWVRLFHFLFESTIINAYILYLLGHEARRNSHKSFRLRLARSLIDNFTSKKRDTPKFKNKKGGVHGVPEEYRMSNVGIHMPEKGTYRRCRYCSTRAHDKRSNIQCITCLVPLCATPCFYNFHK